MNRRVPAVAAVSMAALALAACGGSDDSSSSSSKSKSSGSTAPRLVTGGAATWIPAPATAAQLGKEGIKIGVASGAKRKGKSYVFVLRDGKMVKSGLIGKAGSHGSIVFSRGNRQVEFSDVIVDTARRRVTGIEGGGRIILFLLKIKGLQQTTVKASTFSGTGLSVKLAPGAAKRLNKGLAVKTFKPGTRFGSIGLVVKLAKPGSKPSGSSSSKGKDSTSTTTTSKK